MSSIIMFMMSLYMGNQIQTSRVDHIQHDIKTVAALSDGMLYYQNNAIEKCWNDGASHCDAGRISLTTRNGSSSDMAYGSGYETITDGSTYIVTTLTESGAVSGRTTQNSNINAGVFAALKGMTTRSAQVGYYDQMAGGVVLPERQGQVVAVAFQTRPVQGQPVLYSSIVTASPPAQVASIDGGSYSPLVPIPLSVTPVPTTPAAVVSPPASVSPPDPVSPTYTPPATVVVNPIGPWAPSPVPPPPPPPPPPVPPPPPPPPAIPETGSTPVWITWAMTINASGGSMWNNYGINVYADNGNQLTELQCSVGSDSTSLVAADLNQQVGMYAQGDSSTCQAAMNVIKTITASGSAWINTTQAWGGNEPEWFSSLTKPVFGYNGAGRLSPYMGNTSALFCACGREYDAFGDGDPIQFFSVNALYGGTIPQVPTSSLNFSVPDDGIASFNNDIDTIMKTQGAFRSYIMIEYNEMHGVF